MKKLFAFLLAMLMIVSMLTACAAPAQTAATPAPTQEIPAQGDAETTAAPDTSITVTDQAGNTVTLSEPADRLVTCFYAQTYALMALGLSDRLVAIERAAATRPIYAIAAPELMELPDVGSQKEFNVEAAIAMEPDVMLLPAKLKDTAATFAAVDIPVAICYPESQQLLEEMLVMIATLCGAPEKADALLAYYQETFARVERITSTIPEADKPSVYMCGNTGYLTTAPKTMYQATLIENAGGVNAAADIDGDYWTEVSYEQLLAMNPDVMVIPCEAKYTADDIYADPQLNEVAAVKNKAVYPMPNAFEAWDSCVPSGVLGTLWMLSAIHGELYDKDAMRADAAQFYATFYGCDIDTSLITW